MAIVASVAFVAGLLAGFNFVGTIGGIAYLVGMALIFICLIGSYFANHGENMRTLDEQRRQLQEHRTLLAYQQRDDKLRAVVRQCVPKEGSLP